MKESFIKISEHPTLKISRKLFRKLEKCLFLQRPSETGPLKWQKTSAVGKLMTSIQLKHFQLPVMSQVNDVEQTVLLCRYVNCYGPQEELIELIPLKGQTRGQDICEAVVSCLEAKGKNITNLVSVSTDGSTVCEEHIRLDEFTSKVTGSRADGVSLHPPPRSTVRGNIQP